MKLESVAVLIPSNNYLKGKLDFSKNLSIIVLYLENCGFQLKKISVVDENDKSVASELEILTKFYDIIIILQDFYMQTVSQGLALLSSQDLVEIPDLDNNLWPNSIKLLNYESVQPIPYLQRIFILTLNSLEAQLNFILQNHLKHYNESYFFIKTFNICLNGSKKYVEKIKLDNVELKLEEINENENSVKLISEDFESIVKGELFLCDKFGSANIIRKSKWINKDMFNLIYESTDLHIKNSIDIIEKCLENYGIENVFLSFNGGKDCTVLLHLVETVLYKKYGNQREKIKLFCLYVKSDNTFNEQDEFIEQCRIFYNLEIMSVTGNIKEALEIIIDKKPHLKACFMGTRRTDPFCSHLASFQMTDSDWPQLMRCSPFLDWHYTDIWDYLLFYKVAYCKLYDYGFTSLGNSSNTVRNPSLIYGNQNNTYLPAYKMLNEKKERSGRNISRI